MKIILKILFFLFAVFHTNIVDTKVIVFYNVVSEIKFDNDLLEGKNGSTKILGNDFGLSCKSESNLLDYGRWGIGFASVVAEGVGNNIAKNAKKDVSRRYKRFFKSR